ncbi:alpha-2-macroglobulin family protein [Sulfitobacter donghicola]|uniref:PAN domain protein n=1 Tax=Sulfitobacter donghicola DSW-25 = KCTC 12864 = JCM 14565 TaxID=1300350 RepID=A0A073ILQ0_9RHOB|nr:alpha-2-macroglobulin family protein [Sulfitobacter donghicola]KEJ90495.1 PAN domain protein [Sulfitobacter donghicola DSW-25 = KCTC 12864 = JCM 14565]KIN67736.1 Alpha-2-macroglobulin N-terminal domain family protein [Sulfitobacter donghicola DSW-25 = KCTC 12864 = JCM 14565]
MRILQLLVGVFLLGTIFSPPAMAQNVLPDHRYLYSQDVDFYGADLGPLFDTNRAACVKACDAQPSCVAFTFNTRSKACFPKSEVSETEIFEGAISAKKIRTPQSIQETAARAKAEIEFLRPEDFTAANRLVLINAERFPTGDFLLEDVTAALSATLSRGNMASASRWASQAVAMSDRGDLWAQLAWLGLRPRGEMPRDLARRLKQDAIPAAINAYLRASNEYEQVTALDLLARALEANRRGRDMIAPLRLAQEIEPRQELQAALDVAIGKYGFRIVDTRVDNNSARPRICAEFSENLVQAGTDYTPFVRLQDPTLIVEAGNRDLCIEGVQHGSQYTATFRSGLPAASGEVLHKDVPISLYVRDREPSVRFTGRSYVLPRSSLAALPIETVNLDRVELLLRRVSDRNLLRAIQDSYFGKPLSKYKEDQFASSIAQNIWVGVGDVDNKLNQNVTTRLPMAEALKGQPAGIYALTAKVKGADPYDTPAATQWFVLTDLGLSTLSGVDGLHVNVLGLKDAAVRADVTLSLISRSNEVLGKVATDSNGRAHFEAGLTRGNGSSAPALLMAEGSDGDFAFLSLLDPEFDLSDRGVEGRPPAPPIDTFLTTDRGAYRVGETIHATVLTRDEGGKAVNGLPLVAVLKRPDGAEYSRALSANAVSGGHVFALPLSGQAPRGAWRLDVFADTNAAPLSSQTILVEDFLPDRVEFDLGLPDTPLKLGDAPTMEIEARYLFGAPAADMPVEGEARLSTTRRLDAFQGYLFGRHDQRFNTRTAYLDNTRTDTDGIARTTLKMPKVDELPTQPLQLSVVARISEGSGRPVERRETRGLAPQGPMIGIKPAFDDVLAEGEEAQFDLITTQGEMAVRWTFNRIETRYQWYQNGGNWAWEPITRRIRIDTGESTLTPQPTLLSLPTEWGQYELVVENQNAPYAATSVSVASGWYGGGDTSSTPDFLAVSLDRESYLTGDTAKLRIVAPEAGVANISVLSNRVIEQMNLAVDAGETVIPLNITEEWGSSAYVTASVVRPMDENAGLNPARSLGLAHAQILPAGKQLTVTLNAAQEVDGQAGILEVPVQVSGLKGAEAGYVTLAAVDVGILNLTGFEAPDPSQHYFGQRRLGVGMRDVYGRLIDGLSGRMGATRSGGDASTAAQLQSPPPTEDLMAFFSGPVKLDANGRTVIKVERPAFNGTIRLMAVAWSETAVGNATSDVVARDPVVMTASLPRLMAPQDSSRLLLELVHTGGAAGVMALDITADAGVDVRTVSGEVNLTEGGSLRLPLDLRALEVGDHNISVKLTTPDGQELKKTLILPVRLNDPEVATTRRFALEAGQTFTFDAEAFAGLHKSTASATLTAGPLARFDVPGLLQQLNRYPYGCTEQVTSATVPLLYLSGLAENSGLGTPSEIDAKIQAGISRVLARQASNGAFGLWRAGSGNFWLDAYVTDFLWRAQSQGHHVPQRALSAALDNLRNRINFAPDFDSGGEDIAYALLVLARAGAAQMGDLRYYADTKAAAFSTPMAAAQLGAALAAYGEPTRADRMFARSAALLLKKINSTQWRNDFGSALRDRAAVLELATLSQSQAIDLDGLAESMSFRRNLSTQEAAQVVLAAHALEAAPNNTLEVDGVAATGPVVRQLSGDVPSVSQIRNTGAEATDITLTTYGVPQTPPVAGGYGYALTRKYFSMEGEEITGPVASGTRLVAVLEVTPFEEIGARLMIDDPLPGGFEIDNPNLLNSASITALKWIKVKETQNVEFRADRFLAAVDHESSDAFQLAYVVRAVTPGEYHHPAALVSDMYRPEYRAHTASDRLIVTP